MELSGLVEDRVADECVVVVVPLDAEATAVGEGRRGDDCLPSGSVVVVVEDQRSSLGVVLSSELELHGVEGCLSHSVILIRP